MHSTSPPSMEERNPALTSLQEPGQSFFDFSSKPESSEFAPDVSPIYNSVTSYTKNMVSWIIWILWQVNNILYWLFTSLQRKVKKMSGISPIFSLNCFTQSLVFNYLYFSIVQNAPCLNPHFAPYPPPPLQSSPPYSTVNYEASDRLLNTSLHKNGEHYESDSGISLDHSPKGNYDDIIIKQTKNRKTFMMRS